MQQDETKRKKQETMYDNGCIGPQIWDGFDEEFRLPSNFGKASIKEALNKVEDQSSLLKHIYPHFLPFTYSTISALYKSRASNILRLKLLHSRQPNPRHAPKMRPTTILYTVLLLAAPAFTLPLHLGMTSSTSFSATSLQRYRCNRIVGQPPSRTRRPNP